MFGCTFPYRAGRIHIEAGFSDCRFCPDVQTHVPVDRGLLPRSIHDFSRCIQTNPVAMQDLRRIIGQTACAYDLACASEGVVLAQVAERLANGSLQAIQCGFENTADKATLFFNGERHYHLGLSLEQMVTCRSYHTHKVISVNTSDEVKEVLAGAMTASHGKTELRKVVRMHAHPREELRTDEAILENLANMIINGQIILVGCSAEAIGSVGAGVYREEAPARTPAQAASAPLSGESKAAGETNEDWPNVKTWIEIRLVDQEGKPVPYERYRLVLPDGTAKEGSLDENGRTRVEDIQPGSCRFSLIDIHAREWHQVS